MKFTITIILLFTIILGHTRKAECQQVKRYSQAFLANQGKAKLNEFAISYYEIGDFYKALPLYEELSDRSPNKSDYLYRTGVCYLFVPNGSKYAIGYLKKVLIINPQKDGLALSLAIAYHGNHEFDQAIRFYNLALKEKLNKADKSTVERRIQACKTAKELVEEPLNIEILNMGQPINSESTEYIPLLSADESTLVFTYNQKDSTLIESLGEIKNSYDDIFIANKINGIWSKPRSISKNINYPDLSESAVGISADGKQIFILMYSEITSGDIYSSKLEGGEWTVPMKLEGDVNSDRWEGGASITKDGKALYFDSERKGGFGGTDIYKAELQSDGSWGNITNLGSTINTPYNDEAAFMHSDNKTLYFSSEGHQNMGGFDIFKSTSLGNGGWEEPKNLGYPINSAGSDKYFVASIDGKRGYYHKDKTDGFGEIDLYMIDFEPNKMDTDSTEVSLSKDIGSGDSPDNLKPFTISGSLINASSPTGSLSNVKVNLIGDDGQSIAQVLSSPEGKFQFNKIGGHTSYELELTFDGIQAALPSTASENGDGNDQSTTSVETIKNSGPQATSFHDAKEVHVTKDAVCTNIVNMEPTEAVTEVTSDIGKIWFHTEVRLPESVEDTIIHKWSFQGKEVARVSLKVKGPRWRTYSSKFIETRMKGSWKVEAISSKGEILATKEFEVK